MKTFILELITTAMKTEIATTTTVEPTIVEPQINGKELLLISRYMVLKTLLCNLSRHLPKIPTLYMFIVLYNAILSNIWMNYRLKNFCI